MFLALNNKYNNSRYKMQHQNLKNGAAAIKSLAKNDISFTSDLRNLLQKNVFHDKTIYVNASKIMEGVDDIFGGDKPFTNAVRTAGLLNEANNTISVKNAGRFDDLINTVKYPFLQFPFDLVNWTLDKAQKTPLASLAKSAANNQILAKKRHQADVQKSLAFVRETLYRCTSKNGLYDFDRGLQILTVDRSGAITRSCAKYSSRDERTLNRMATSTVSALYSARDFYNISILQKDDKSEAKKAEKARLKQELTRMVFSAGTTFFTLGALNKFVKKSIYINALVIAFSALIAEVGSRIINGTPLHPLTPEEAAKIAKQKKAKANKLTGTQKQENKTTEPKKQENKADEPKKEIAFKSSNDKVFSQFASKDGTIAPLKSLSTCDVKETKKSNPKKKGSLKNKLILASTVASAVYLASKGLSGEFSAKIQKRELYGKYKNKILDFARGNVKFLDEIAKEELQKINAEFEEKYTKFNVLGRLENFIVNEKKHVYLKDLAIEIKKLKNTKDGRDIEGLLNIYQDRLNKIQNEQSIFSCAIKDERFLIAGIYKGISKIFKMIYSILSLPGAALNGLADVLFFSRSNKITEKVTQKLDNMDPKKIAKRYADQLGELAKIINKYTKNQRFDKITDSKEKAAAIENLYNEAAKQIKRNTRSYEQGAETGDLANLSRTMVTAITTYFFVNDYSNKVLIESEGKNVEEAREERNDRIAHKLSNFILNGTLMNLFNSVFKTQLNESLINATVIAAATETTNEYLVRKSICQPVRHMKSKQEIIDYEQEQIQRKGFMGMWSKMYRKLTGKKTLMQKAGIEVKEDKKVS